MESTLQDGDNLICDKLSYHLKNPERFDIVVIETNEDEKHWIKRIIGLPGEEVFIYVNGNIYINGEKLDEKYGKEVIQDAGIAMKPIQLGEDEYWVMGDNRNRSRDSRAIGAIKREQILGKAILRIFPLEKIGFIER